MKLIYPRNKGFFYSVVLILLIILTALTITAFTPASEPAKNIAQISSPTPAGTNLCAPLTVANKDEISCEEAGAIALEKSPGKIISIDRNPIIPAGFIGDPEKLPKLWLITIKPDTANTKGKDTYFIGINILNGKIEYAELR